MSQVTLTAPDGKTITLTPPEGATPEEVQAGINKVVSQFGGGAPAAAAAPELAPGAEPVGNVSSGPVTRVGGGGLVRPPATPPPPGDTLREVTPAEHYARVAEDYGAAGLGAAAAAAAGTAAAAALPAALPASLALGAVVAANAFGGVVSQRLLRKLGGRPAPTKYETSLEALADSLPVVIGAAVGRSVMTPAEERELLTSITPEGQAAAKRAALEAVGPKPEPPAALVAGKPKAPAAPTLVKPETPELSPLRAPETPRGFGPEMTNAATEALGVVETEKRARYAARDAVAQRLGIEVDYPPEVAQQAADALAQIDASGLEPTQKDAARKVLESLRDRKTPKRVTFAQLDADRQKLQDIAPDFIALSKPSKSFKESSVGKLLGTLKRSVESAVSGTEAGPLHQAAEDYYVNEVLPMRSIQRATLRGEIEPAALVDVMTSKRWASRFERQMEVYDRQAPEIATKIRQTKYNSMIDQASTDGRFDTANFRKQFGRLPPSTQRALAGPRGDSEIAHLMNNIETARNRLGSHAIDLNKAATEAHAQAVAAHEAATRDYQAAKLAYSNDVAAWRQNVRLADTPPPTDTLVAARRKLAAQQQMLQMPADVATVVWALNQMVHGNFSSRLFEAVFTPAGLRYIMGSPSGIKATNRMLRFIAAGASPKLISRSAAQVVSHVVANQLQVLLPGGSGRD